VSTPTCDFVTSVRSRFAAAKRNDNLPAQATFIYLIQIIDRHATKSQDRRYDNRCHNSITAQNKISRNGWWNQM